MDINSATSHIETLYAKGYDLSLGYAPKLFLSIITLVLGFWLIKGVSKLLVVTLDKSKVDPTLVPFLNSLLTWTLKALLFISIASMLGVATTSFVAVLGAAGLAVGLALQGSLSNFAGGVLVMIFKPYRVGDLIEAQGLLGVVKEVQIFNTILVSPQNKQIIIPNGLASNGTVTNYSAEGILRVDLTVGISYDSNIKVAKDILLEVMAKNEMVLSDPAPFVGVSEMADSSVNLAVRPHCKVEHYWDVYFGINEAMKNALDEHQITIPFPQRDVHMIPAE